MWRPASAAELASVGDDRALLLWDTRAPHDAPSARVADAHGAHDLHCADWSALQPHLVATGAPPAAPAMLSCAERGCEPPRCIFCTAWRPPRCSCACVRAGCQWRAS